MKKLLLAILMLSTLFLTAESVNLSPTSDLYTDIEHPSTSNIFNELWVANFPASGMFQRINLDFDIDEYLNDTLELVILNLTRFYSCPSGGSTVVKIYPIAEDWDENSWSSSQHLAYYENIYLEFLLSGAGGNVIKEFNLDLTEIVNQVINNELEFNGFVMIANNNQKFSKFYSKEYSNLDYRPSLSLRTTPVSNDITDVNSTSLNLTAYPNPFNPTTTIEFTNPKNKVVEVSLYNIRGRLIRNIERVEVVGAKNRVTWDGRDNNKQEVTSGLYFCKVKVGKLVNTRKLILQK